MPEDLQDEIFDGEIDFDDDLTIDDDILLDDSEETTGVNINEDEDDYEPDIPDKFDDEDDY